MAGKKILVADDSLTIQKVIRLALSGDGYEIQTVSDGKEAMEQASLFRPDICIIDVSLPHFDAYQIREQLLAKPDLKKIPVILMSSAFEKVDEERAQKLGFAGHLIKPFDPSHLRSTLLSVSSQAPANDPVTETINEPLQFVNPSANVAPSAFQDFPPITMHEEEMSGFHVGPSTQYSDPFQDTPKPLDDIQELAKDTFDLSGHHQQEWGMIEPGKIEEAFDDIQLFDHPVQAPTPSNTGEIGHFDLHEAPAPMAVHPEEIEAIVKAEVSKMLDQMQAAMQNRLEDDLHRFARELMPNLAERIIKEEIHKLLTNPPV